jgi:hypothetical protein
MIKSLVALARSTHGLEAADHGVVQTNEAFAPLVGLVLIADAAERERSGYRREGGFGDGDL